MGLVIVLDDVRFRFINCRELAAMRSSSHGWFLLTVNSFVRPLVQPLWRFPAVGLLVFFMEWFRAMLTSEEGNALCPINASFVFLACVVWSFSVKSLSQRLARDLLCWILVQIKEVEWNFLMVWPSLEMKTHRVGVSLWEIVCARREERAKSS